MSELKKKVGQQAAAMVEDGQKLGLGTGSTVYYFLEELGRRIRNENLRVVGIPTSIQTEEVAGSFGIPLTTFDETLSLDFYVDGADEIDGELRMIKGGGGALLREKIVASASARKVIIVDGSKVVDRLGRAFPLPVEVVPFAWKLCEVRLRSFDCEPVLRLDGDGKPFRTNNGNRILDCRFPEGIDNPPALEKDLNQIPGVICNGLFIRLADEALVGKSDHVARIKGIPSHGRNIR